MACTKHRKHNKTRSPRCNTHMKSNILEFLFVLLAHLSTKCSGWAIVTGLCPSSVVRRPSSVVRRASSVVRKLFYLNIFSSETTHLIWTKLHRNDPWVVPYQSCSNDSDWLHKLVTGSKNRFSKCNFQKSSCLKLQGPELSYLVYSII